MTTPDAQTVSAERRSSFREKVSVPARLGFNGKVIDVTIIDLSEGGFAASTSEPVAVGTCVDVHLNLPGRSEPVQCNGIVAWATKNSAGVEFSFVTAISAEVIEQWLSSHSVRRTQVEK